MRQENSATISLLKPKLENQKVKQMDKIDLQRGYAFSGN